MGTVGTLLLENPLGQNGLTHQRLLSEAAKVFGLRSRKLKLFLNETQMDGEKILEHIKFLFRLFLLQIDLVTFTNCRLCVRGSTTICFLFCSFSRKSP